MSDKPARFDHYLNRAEVLSRSPGRVQRLMRQATAKLVVASSTRLRDFQQQIKLAIALLRDTYNGRYRGIESRSLMILLAGVLYFVVPLDVVPDFLFGWGLVDDAAVMGYVFSILADELAAYEQWRSDPSFDPAGAETPERERGPDESV